MPEKFISQLDKLISIIIKAVIFLLPLFFLPWTSEYFEFNKQFLLWLLMPIAALLWLYKAARRGQVKIKINPLNLPILIFLLLTAAAAWFSLDRFSSFFGYFGRFSDAWLGLFSLIIFYFLIINTELANGAQKTIDLLKLFLYSSSLVAAISLFAMFGGLEALTSDLLSVFSPASFNLAGGSLLALGIYLTIISIILANFLINGGLKKFDNLVFSLGLIMSLIILALVNFSLSWALLFAGAVLIIFFRCLAAGFNFRQRLNHNLLIPAILILLAVFFLAWPKASPAKIILGQDLPREVLMEYGQAFTIAKEAVKKHPALGSGPGSFAQDFSLYRPAELNQGAFWQIRFDKSSSHILEILATAGLLTALSYFLVISLVIYLNIVLIRAYLKKSSQGSEKYFKSESAPLTDKDYNLIVSLFTAFTLIFFSQLFFLTNTVLNFIFWFCLGLIIAFWHRHNQVLFKEKIVDLNQSVLFQRLLVLALFILSAGGIMLLAFEVKFFAADIAAARESNRETNLLMAIKLNPYRYNYRISLAKLYLSQARAEVLKPIEQKNNAAIQLNITRAIEMAKQAQDQAPNSVLANETMGMIYRDSRPLTIGSETWAVKSFERAVSLEPTNPVLAIELAKAYLNDNDLSGAEKYFNQALELKGDYYEAKFGLAKTYLSGRKDNQALALLNELAREVKTAEVYYELGRYYYNHGEINKAIDRFNLVLSLFPRHSNSLYSLGIAYEAQGKFKEALKYLEKALELNPGNEEVERKIKELSR